MDNLSAARDRRFAMLAMREAGWTYQDIGAAYGIRGQTAAHACKRALQDIAEHRPEWAGGKDVSVRVINGVKNDIGPDATREQIEAISPRQWMRVPNFGKHALRELCELLGYEWWPGITCSETWERIEKPEPSPIADARTGWRPIETAPKDGAWVLLRGGTTEMDECNYHDLAKPPCVVAQWEPGSYEGGGYWTYGFYDGFVGMSYDDPKEWHQLPP